MDNISNPSPFTEDVVRAIAKHMNEDHQSDNLLLCQILGNRPAVTEARVVDVDANGISFDAIEAGIPTAVRLPWSFTLTERAQVRAELARMVNEIDPDRAKDHG